MSTLIVLKRIFIVLVFCGIVACSGTGGPRQNPVPIEDEADYTETPHERTPVEVPQRAEPPSVSAAYIPLLLKAEEATERGDFEQALALLERAQRIDPVSADIYLSMAKTHRARGDEAQSQATAQRGLLYCSSTIQCEALRQFAH